MTFVPAQSQIETQETTLTNDGFFSDVTTQEFRAAMNVGTDFDDTVVENGLTNAMFSINTQLSDWRKEQIAAGYAIIEDTPAPLVAGQTQKVFFYKQAVFSYARARLLEMRRDISTTDKGHDRADNLEGTIADYERQAHESVQAILGRNRVTVELI